MGEICLVVCWSRARCFDKERERERERESERGPSWSEEQGLWCVCACMRVCMCACLRGRRGVGEICMYTQRNGKTGDDYIGGGGRGSFVDLIPLLFLHISHFSFSISFTFFFHSCLSHTYIHTRILMHTREMQQQQW